MRRLGHCSAVPDSVENLASSMGHSVDDLGAKSLEERVKLYSVCEESSCDRKGRLLRWSELEQLEVPAHRLAGSDSAQL